MTAPIWGQLSLALPEPVLLHAPVEFAGWFSVNSKRGKSAKLEQQMYRVSDMPVVLANLDYDRDQYVSQNSFLGPRRRAVNVLSLNLGWIDFDYYKHPDPAVAAAPPRQFLTRILDRCDEKQIPPPSFAVASGGGLYCKWLWSHFLSRAATSRWQALERHLHRVFADLMADSSALLVTQILRIPGTTNTKDGGRRRVEVIWVNGAEREPVRYDFDTFCTAVFPYTREEVAAWRAARALVEDRPASPRSEELQQFRENGRKRDADRVAQAAKRALAKVFDLESPTAKLISQDFAADLWNSRLELMRAVAKVRWPDGVPVGLRNDWLWVAANAMAWMSSRREMRFDVQVLAREFAPGFSTEEVNSSVSSVLSRLNGGGRLYSMKNVTFHQKLGLTQAEVAAFYGRHHPATCNEGAMGFEPMRGLDYDEYKAETARRQSAAGIRTVGLLRSATADKRATARLMRASGRSVKQIADELGVAPRTVQYWTNG